MSPRAIFYMDTNELKRKASSYPSALVLVNHSAMYIRRKYLSVNKTELQGSANIHGSSCLNVWIRHSISFRFSRAISTHCIAGLGSHQSREYFCQCAIQRLSLSSKNVLKHHERKSPYLRIRGASVPTLHFVFWLQICCSGAKTHLSSDDVHIYMSIYLQLQKSGKKEVWPQRLQFTGLRDKTRTTCARD